MSVNGAERKVEGVESTGIMMSDAVVVVFVELKESIAGVRMGLKFQPRFDGVSLCRISAAVRLTGERGIGSCRLSW